MAGSESTATTCASTTYFSLKHPQVHARLQKEIRDAFESLDEVTISSTAKLPYLQAVMSEAIRLHPVLAVAGVRDVDRPGVKICGYDVPLGTRVGIPQKTMCRSATNFANPNMFVPERWLPEADPIYQADRKEASEPFGIGGRSCLGKALAWAEMKMILCKVIWSFDMKLAEGNTKDWSMDPKVYTLHERTPLYIQLSRR
ncbi:MAG: hypothetical protein Q9222_007268 [Ikaeria aurantiellina]